MNDFIDLNKVRTAVPETQPLYREIPPAESFPIEALGDFSEAAQAIQRIIQAPDAICGQSILAGLTLAAQPFADVVVDGRCSPLSCFFTSVAESGERKSAVDAVATLSHRVHEENLEIEYQNQLKQYNREFAAWKQSRDEGMKGKKSKLDKLSFLDDHGDEPEPPIQPIMLVEEPTLEAIHKILSIGQPSIGLFSDEAGRLIGGHAMNQDNALKTAAGLSSLWDRGEAKRSRSGDGHTSLKGKRLSMHIMMQPIVAEQMLGSEIFSGQGLLSRMLITWPESITGQRSYTAEDAYQNPAVMHYLGAVTTLLERPPPVNEFNQLNPPKLELSPDAKQLFIRFHDHCDRNAANGATYESVRGLANKAPELATRLAGVFTVVSGHACIDADAMERGIQLMKYYLNEAIRISSAGQISQGLKDAQLLLNWLREKEHRLLHPVLVYQNAPSRRLRTKKGAKAAIHILQDHGWLSPINDVEIDGKKRREAWRLNDV
jgi:hypothetical protein